jgi:hypothetical protein
MHHTCIWLEKLRKTRRYLSVNAGILAENVTQELRVTDRDDEHYTARLGITFRLLKTNETVFSLKYGYHYQLVSEASSDGIST